MGLSYHITTKTSFDFQYLKSMLNENQLDYYFYIENTSKSFTSASCSGDAMIIIAKPYVNEQGFLKEKVQLTFNLSYFKAINIINMDIR